MLDPESTFGMLVPSVKALASAEKIESATDGNITKFKVVTPSTETTSYLIYDNGAFDKVVVETVMKKVIGESIEVDMKVKMQGQVWDGNIKFPNPKDYEEMPMDM